MQYRREIDGLRAVAVLPVIAFHAGLPAFSGGFVGVDVFFVISGYLITSLLLGDLARDRLSIVDFYERRARRILPALFLVLLCCIPPALLLLPPWELKSFAKSLAAVPLFSSNFIFFSESGYFDTDAELKPLLHTWSLAVEEQYYLLFPPVLLLLWRHLRTRLLAVLVLFTVAGLVLAEWGVRHTPSAAFYLLPMRAWELLAGAALAVVLADRPAPAAGGWQQWLAAIGLGFIGCAIVLYDRHTPFPGLAALLPVVGTMLVIAFAVPSAGIGVLLAWRPVVAVGLVSYSAYLWHNPLLVFARHHAAELPDDTPYILAAVALTFVLAWASWRFVETPFRDRRRVTRRAVFLFSVAGGGLLVLAGAGGWLLRGNVMPADPALAAIHAAKQSYNPERDKCLSREDRVVTPEASCVAGNPARVRTALLGDSHADALSFALGQALAQMGEGVRVMAYPGCPPVAGVYRAEFPYCATHNATVLRHLDENRAVDVVILLARWSLFVAGERFDNGEGGVEPAVPVHVDALVAGKPVVSSRDEDRVRHILGQYVAGVRAHLAAGRTVILVYPVPEQGWDVPAKLARLYRTQGRLNDVDGSTGHALFRARNALVNDAFDAMPDHPALVRVRPEQVFCNTVVAGRCIAHLDAVPLYYDDDHLSAAGAALVASAIVQRLPRR